MAGRIADLGLVALTPAQGLAALQRVLEGEANQVAVAIVDWPRYLARLPGADTPFLAEFAAAGGSTSRPEAAASQVAQSALRIQLAEAPPGRRRTIVAAFVRERTLKALGIDPSRTVDPRMSLSDLGLDSLLAVELRNTLSSALGCSLPATLLFDYPNMNALTDFLLDELQGEETPAETPGSAANASAVDAGTGLVGSIESMSDDDVERMLAQRAQRAKAE
jgi:acyl carrier protein